MYIFKKIHFHGLYFVVALIAVLTGFFKEFVVFNGILLFHELGHVLVGLYYQWNIEKILILPFGAVTIFQEKMNRPIYEEFLISIAGIGFQMILYFLVCALFSRSMMFDRYHWSIILFNLLPIYPLDGSKLLNLILSYFLPFRFCHIVGIVMSFLFVGLFFWFWFDLVSILIVICLFQRIVFEIRHHGILFYHFLLERYLYNFHFKRRKYLKSDDVNLMVRGCFHFFSDGEKMITEKEMLKKRFDFSYYV